MLTIAAAATAAGCGSTAKGPRQVRNGGGGMPSFAGRITTKEIHALAVYVFHAAGR